MWKPMSGRERVLITLTVCLALLVVPLTALAATGQLVNIVDPTVESRVANVEGGGYLRVNTQRTSGGAFVTPFAKNPTVSGYNWMSSHNFTGSVGVTGEKVVISWVDVSMTGAGPIDLNLLFYRMPSPSASCSNPKSAGGIVGNVRHWILTGPGTTQLRYDTVPLTLNLVAGQKICLGLETTTTSGQKIFGSIGGYTLFP